MAQQFDPEKYQQLGEAEISLTIRGEPTFDAEKYKQLGDAPVEEPGLVIEPSSQVNQGFLSRTLEGAFTTPEFVKPFYQKMREGSETGIGKAIRAGNPLSNLLLSKTGIDMMESMTTPGDVALTLGTGGIGTAAKIGRGLQKVSGGLLSARGGERIATEETLAGKAVGVAELVGGLFGMRTPKIKPTGVVDEVIPEVAERTGPQSTLLDWLKKAKPLTRKQKNIRKEEFAERIGKMEGIEETGVAGYYRRRGQLAGEYTKVEIEPLSDYINPEGLDELVNNIKASPDLLSLEQDSAIEGLLKLYNGNLAQPKQLEKLMKVFGDDAFINMARRDPKNIFSKTQDFMRAVMTAYDFSGVLRQGRGFISRAAYWKAIPKMFKAWGSDKAYKALMQSIKEHPNFIRGRNTAGKLLPSKAEIAELDITDLLLNREEIFLSRAAEKIPGIKMSERAYLGFLNKLRADVFNDILKNAQKSGRNIDDPNLLKQIGALVNDATGRGDLGKLSKHADLLGATFFAPKLHAGRIRMWNRVLNPVTLMKQDPIVRKEALRSMIASTALGLSIGELFRMAGAQVSNDPTSADFRKVRIGSSRLDPFSGDQQYGVLMARYLTGTFTSSTSGRQSDIWNPGFGQMSAKDITESFVTGKLAPLTSLAYALLRRSDFGQDPRLPFSESEAIIRRVTPIVAQDLYEIAQEDPELLPIFGPPAVFGMGTQTYGR